MKSLIFNMLFVLSLSTAFAHPIQGVVTNKKNEPIQDAYIINEDSGAHTHTDEKGLFFLEGLDIGDVLKITHVGYFDQEVTVKHLDKVIQIQLQRRFVNLKEVAITPEIDALNVFTRITLKTAPVNSSQDILRKVPGLFIGQHAGGGKAEQMFLRGFDLDHGTDINISVDGMPVNMVSHAHGQGYSDLHFVIPETIDKIDFGKGSYNADKGNFATAGYVAFKTKDRLDKSKISAEIGQFNTQRIMAMLNLYNRDNHSVYVASEYLLTDGAFDSPQNFSRINLFTKYTGVLANRDEINFSASYFDSKWDASGQVPQRAVDAGSISRFGSIDDSEGGVTSRTNIKVGYTKHLNDSTSIRTSMYLNKYDFQLFSNFTFFLNDPINGDEIKQKENREIYGLQSEYRQKFKIKTFPTTLKAGIQLRSDNIKANELSHTVRRNNIPSGAIKLGDVRESNIGAFASLDVKINKFLINLGLRLDHFNFGYNDDLQPRYNTQKIQSNIFSPKLNILYNASNNFQLYLKSGKGFHSNDTRVVIAQQGKQTLPASYSGDLGFIWKPIPELVINSAFWNLYLEQEFVYVGDEGVVEPSGQTNRLGIDLGFRYQLLEWLFLDFDTNYAHARSIEEPEGQNYIPLAPDLTMTSGLSAVHSSGVFGNINVRHMNDRPANEDNTIVAKPYTVTDANIGYQLKAWRFSLIAQNIFNVEWNETQFATETRLKNESTPVEEIHFTPGTPLFVKTKISYSF